MKSNQKESIRCYTEFVIWMDIQITSSENTKKRLFHSFCYSFLFFALVEN